MRSTVGIVILLAPWTRAFVPCRRRQTSKRLFGISEWRDRMFDVSGGAGAGGLGTEAVAPPKEVCILPFPYEEVLLQGETKQLRLYEDRFIDLFDYVMEHNDGVVAMGLVAQSGIIQSVALCEIEAYNRMEGFGIFVTIRVVGRATLERVSQQEPFLKGVCREIADAIPPNLELPNLLAGNIEHAMLQLSSMEHQLAQAEEESGDGETLEGPRLDDRFFNEIDEDDDEDEDSDQIIDLDRRGRFTMAYKVAMSTDTQGYCVSQPQSALGRTPQELVALSWAAFCTNIAEEDATYRIQALDSDRLFDRLKLASHMLREKKSKLQQRMEKAGLEVRKDDDFDEEV